MATGLFDYVDEEALTRQQRGDDAQLAQMDYGDWATYQMMQNNRNIGRNIGNVIGGLTGADMRTPAQRKNQSLDQIKAAVMQSGVEPGSDDYYKQLIGLFRQNGLLAEANAVMAEWETTKRTRAQTELFQAQTKKASEGSDQDKLWARYQEVLDNLAYEPENQRYVAERTALETRLGVKAKTAGKVIDKTIDLGDKVRVQYADGTTEDLPKGIAPKAAKAGGDGNGLDKLDEKILPEQFKDLGDARDAAVNARGVLNLVNSALATLDKPNYIGAGVGSALERSYNRISGGGDPDKLRNTQEFDAAVKRIGFGEMKSTLKNGFTDADIKTFQEMSGNKQLTKEQARSALLSTAARANEMIQNYTEGRATLGGRFGERYTGTFPKVSAPAVTAPAPSSAPAPAPAASPGPVRRKFGDLPK